MKIKRLELSNVTGHDKAEVFWWLAGALPLADDFLQKVCSKFGYRIESIEQGADERIDMGSYSMLGAVIRHDPRAGGDAALDAPTQEIVNDMKRLTESNRWVFVGRVKPIIQAMIEEQRK